MDKISFLSDLCIISHDAEVNRKNYDAAMNFGNTINVVFDILREISDRFHLGSTLKVYPVDFIMSVGESIDVRWRTTSRKKIDILTETLFEKNGFPYIMHHNPDGVGYILSVKNQGVGTV
jgi:hypothetical protein